MLKEFCKLIKLFIFKFKIPLSHERQKTNTPSSACSSGSSVLVKDIPSDINWNTKNVLIGTVRTLQQLSYNLQNNCYFAPAKFVYDENLPVKCIALFEEDLDGTQIIRRKGYVSKAKIVKREQIPVPMNKKNGDEPYYFFEIDKWELMEKQIIVKDTLRGKPLFTNEFLLGNCKYSYQLFSVDSDNDYQLMKIIENLYENNSGYYKIDSVFSIGIDGDKFVILNRCDDFTYEFLISDYIKRPRQIFNRIKEIINMFE